MTWTRWLRKAGKFLALLLLVACLLGVGYYLVFTFLAQREYRAFERDRDQLVSAARSGASPASLVTLDKNAANFYESALQISNTLPYPHIEFDELLEPLLKAQPSKNELAALEAELARQQKALALVEQGVRLPGARFEAFQEEERAPDTRRIVIDHSVDLLEAKALSLIWTGQGDAVMATLQELHLLATQLARQPDLLGAFMQLATERALLRLLELLVVQAPPSEQSLRAFYAELGKADTKANWVEAASGRRLEFLANPDPYVTGEKPLANLLEMTGSLYQFSWIARHCPPQLRYLALRDARLLLSQEGELLLKVRAAPDLRSAMQYAKPYDIDLNQPTSSLFMRMTMAYYAASLRTALSAEACLACERGLLVLALAVQKTGNWPASLAAAEQITGLEVPQDPATGQPLEYSFDGRQARLSSAATAMMKDSPIQALVRLDSPAH